MNIFERYVLRSIVLTMVAATLVLTVIIMLTQSLRFLELVIESNASAFSFWTLTLLAVPRFFEVILPLALMTGVLSVYNRLANDSELPVIRSGGASSLYLARPAIVLGVLTTAILIFMTSWASPKSLAQMQQFKQIVKAQLSSALIRDGVFNQMGRGLTVYVREKIGQDDLRGILIHDTRDPSRSPATITAKRGYVAGDENGFEVIVFEGSRQDFNVETGTYQQLDFERYVVDLPDNQAVRQRWKEDDERTLFELMNPDLNNAWDRENLKSFRLEIHRRLVAPFLALTLSLVASVIMLKGTISRRGYMMRIVSCVIVAIFIEGVFLAASDWANKSVLGLLFMYSVIFIPICWCFFVLWMPVYKLNALFKMKTVATS